METVMNLLCSLLFWMWDHDGIVFLVSMFSFAPVAALIFGLFTRKSESV
jgi:hypothetical protein